jgi:hypothetical protein
MNYYDPWGHAFKLFVNRLLLFVFLAISSSALLWTWLLVSFYGFGWKVIVGSAWALPQGGGEMHWRLMFWLTAACGTLVTSTLFAALMRRSRMRRGDRHRRGARVVHADADHDDE